ncbi:MAG: hypothetical protein ACI8X3_002567, partial [Saprospiraceae bacterium]
MVFYITLLEYQIFSSILTLAEGAITMPKASITSRLRQQNRDYHFPPLRRDYHFSTA